jgi:hypothetical protein
MSVPGKTELAETIGDKVARQEGIDITLLPLSLSSRGQGRVGEMTQLVSAAFEHAFKEASSSSSSRAARAAVSSFWLTRPMRLHSLASPIKCITKTVQALMLSFAALIDLRMAASPLLC